VYPLAVAARSSDPPGRAVTGSSSSGAQGRTRQQVADEVLSYMRSQPGTQELVAQAELLSGELIRVSILWHELWHEALEESSRLWFGEHNFRGLVLVTLRTLIRILEITFSCITTSNTIHFTTRNSSSLFWYGIIT